MTQPNMTKRAAILAAAYKVFTTYGYRRSNMADIAREAGMSRPALYQVFRNKEDIFRAYVIDMKAAMVAAVRRTFADDASFQEKLYRALDGAMLEPHRYIESTPHGAEIIGVKTEIAGDLFDGWLNEVEAALCEAFEDEAVSGRVTFEGSGFDAPSLARLVINTMEGIKMRMDSVRTAEAGVRDLVRLVGAAVAGRKSAGSGSGPVPGSGSGSEH